MTEGVLLLVDSARDPLLRGLMLAMEQQNGKRPDPIAIEVREDEVADILGPLAPLATLLERLGALIVVDGVELRPRRTGLGRNRFMPIYACRACGGAGCARCGQSGERRGRP